MCHGRRPFLYCWRDTRRTPTAAGAVGAPRPPAGRGRDGGVGAAVPWLRLCGGDEEFRHRLSLSDGRLTPRKPGRCKAVVGGPVVSAPFPLKATAVGGEGKR